MTSVDETRLRIRAESDGRHHMVLRAVQQQHRLGDLRQLAVDQPEELPQRVRGVQRHPVVADLLRALLGDVARRSPWSYGTKWRATGRAYAARPCTLFAGFTTTIPLTASPCFAASRSASAPPIESPKTKTWLHRSSSARSSRSTSAYQSCQPVTCMSCQRVPCPGSSGRDTVRPRSARYSAQGRSDCGEPVNPWQRRTPTSPPSWRNGSAPGRTGTGVSFRWSGHGEVASDRAVGHSVSV